jgi:hypothetical protein
MFVAEVLGLPPQDFEVTVRVWTLLFYLPIWTGVFYILTLVFALFAFISAGILSLITSSSLVNIFATKARWKLVLDRFVFRSFGHAGGAFMFAAITAAGLTWYFSAITRLEPAIRLTAYYADYQIVPRYPGVDTTRRLRLHPNGVVSYAEKHGWDVLISVDKVQREVGQTPL